MLQRWLAVLSLMACSSAPPAEQTAQPSPPAAEPAPPAAPPSPASNLQVVVRSCVAVDREATEPPRCRVVDPPQPMVDAEPALESCARARPIDAGPVDLEVVMRSGLIVSGPDPARGCVQQALGRAALVDPPTRCTIALGDPRLMQQQKAAVGAHIHCPPGLE